MSPEQSFPCDLALFLGGTCLFSRVYMFFFGCWYWSGWIFFFFFLLGDLFQAESFDFQDSQLWLEFGNLFLDFSISGIFREESHYYPGGCTLCTFAHHHVDLQEYVSGHGLDDTECTRVPLELVMKVCQETNFWDSEFHFFLTGFFKNI